MSGRAGNDPFGWLTKTDAEIDADEVRSLNRDMTEAANRQLREQGLVFLDVFGTPAGSALLEDLRARTIEMPLMDVGGVIGKAPEIGIGPAEWAFYREGQNSVIRYIETMMRHALRTENEEDAPDA